MRELTVRIKFVKACLGNVRDRGSADGRFLLPRSPAGAVLFLAQWHRSNMNLAARVLGRWQGEVKKILWDVSVDGVLRQNRWYRRYYESAGDSRRHAVHEAFFPGQVIGINCVVPTCIPDEDLWALFKLAGQYKGLSPFQPGEFGHFEVVSIRSRRASPEGSESLVDGLSEKKEETSAVGTDKLVKERKGAS